MVVVSSLFLDPETGPLKSQSSLYLVAISVPGRPFYTSLEPTFSIDRVQLTDQLMEALLETVCANCRFLI